MKKEVLFKIYLTYLIGVLILGNMHYLVSVSIADFNRYPLVYIPLAYLVVTFFFNRPLEKEDETRKNYLWWGIGGFTIINVIFRMPILYTIFVIVFLLLAKGKKTRIKEETERYIKEYYERKNKEENQ